MVRKFYGLTKKQLVGFYILIAVVMYFVIFFVPITVIQEDRNGRIVEMSRNLIEVLLTPDVDIEVDLTMPLPAGTGGGVLCIQLFDPVCGIDGITYSNSCFAENAGVSFVAGACEGDAVLAVPDTVNSEPVTGFCQIYPSACP